MAVRIILRYDQYDVRVPFMIFNWKESHSWQGLCSVERNTFKHATSVTFNYLFLASDSKRYTIGGQVGLQYTTLVQPVNFF